MTQKVLILGGRGRVGASVAADVLAHTPATITVTGRQPATADSPPQCQAIALDLDDRPRVERAIADHDLVIHCAGPFGYRDTHVLTTCLAQGVPYLDVADNPRYVRKALDCRDRAIATGTTAIVSTGVFPGISNSLVRQGIEQLDAADQVKISYVVAGSGGAGTTVMRTTFLELQHPFPAWINGQRQPVLPYSQRETVEFPAPYGCCGVYWFNTIEAMTLPMSFPVKTVITKFGSLPDFYNHLTWLMAHAAPKSWLRQPETVEFLAKVSYRMTEWTDRLSGIGIAIRVDIDGWRSGSPVRYVGTLAHDNTVAAVGMGTGSVAQSLLSGNLHQPGVWPVEQALSTDLFTQTLAQRGLSVTQQQVSGAP